MPRIDPLQLLECLSILLAPNGGIKGSQEVKRISSLMLKFSKKLVSKCIYIQILKCSETDLLGQFMEIGGWNMTHGWLEDAINTDNWPLVQEILELFLLCPVDVARLNLNNAPRLVKTLSKEGKHEGVKILSARLVKQWLKCVKGEPVAIPATNQQINVDQVSFHQHPVNMQLLDPSHPSYTDSLAIGGDELGGLGALGTGDIDVDEIIPTLNHDEDGFFGIVDGTGAEADMDLDSVPVEGEEVDGHAVSSTTARSCRNTHSSSNNVNQSSLSNNNNGVVVVAGGEEKENKLKIKITMKDGQTKVTSSTSCSSSSGGGKDDAESGSRSKSSSSSRSEKKSSSSSSSRDKDRKSSKSSSSSSGHKSSSSSSSSSSSKSRSHSSSSSSSKSSSRDKERGSSSSSSSRSHSASSKSTSSSSSSSSSRPSKESAAEKQAEKDKDTLNKVMGGASSTLDKLGKIPKKPRSEEASTTTTTVPAKKSSISIEVRKDPENRPKTVKTFNSQFRDHGLVADIPPPPSRKTLKKQDSLNSTSPSTANAAMKSSAAGLKRASPTKENSATTASSPVSEKRMKLDQIVANAAAGDEKPGGVKLIAPRAKPTLVESDMFMDALCSSAPAKGAVKKRKRIASASKDGSPPPTQPESPKIVAAPMKFYQDTLEVKLENVKKEGEADDDGEAQESPSKKAALDDDAIASPTKDKDPQSPTKSPKSPDDPESPSSGGDKTPTSPALKTEPEEMETEEDEGPKPPGPGCGPNGPPGVLVLHRRRPTKKSVRWRPQESLEEVRLFELDETERVNVTKTFTDMKQMERFGERDAFQMARKLQNDDVMVEQTGWTALIEVDDVPVTATGGQSKERDVQNARELTCLQALYFSYNMIPDSPAEPEAETYKYAEPAVIPLEDVQNTVNDFTKQGWPEPKEMGAGLAGVGGPGGVGIFNGVGPGGPMGGPFDNPFSQPPPFGINPNLQPFGGNPGIWATGGAAPPPFGPGLINDDIKLAMNRLAFPDQPFNPPNFNGVNMLNLPAMGAGGPMGGPPPGGPNGPWGFRGPPPTMGGGQWRNHGPGGPMDGPRNTWINNNNGPRPPCKNFKKGYCKKGDKCNFSHAAPFRN